MAAMVAMIAGVSSLRIENTSTATSSRGPVRSSRAPAASDMNAPAAAAATRSHAGRAATAIAAKLT